MRVLFLFLSASIVQGQTIPSSCIQAGVLVQSPTNLFNFPPGVTDATQCAQNCLNKVGMPITQGTKTYSDCQAVHWDGPSSICFGFEVAPTKFSAHDQATYVDMACVKGASGAGSTPGSFAGLSDADKLTVCCLWAVAGECDQNPFFMKVQCATACGTPGCTVASISSCPTNLSPTCSGGGGGGAAAPAPGGGACENTGGGNCDSWAASGECNANPYWMKVFCAKSCNSCGTTPAGLDAARKDPRCPNADKLSGCGYWASTQQCITNPIWMNANCPSSCKQCNSSPTL